MAVLLTKRCRGGRLVGKRGGLLTNRDDIGKSCNKMSERESLAYGLGKKCKQKEINGKDLLYLHHCVSKIKMATFIGEYSSKLDDRSRLVLPSQLKNCVDEGEQLRFVVKKSLYDPCLEMFTMDEWKKESEQLKSRLDFFNPEHVRFWRDYMRDRDIVEPDAKFGRISISRNLLDAIGVEKDVVFFGIDFKIEVWAKESFLSSRLSDEKYIAIAESLSK